MVPPNAWIPITGTHSWDPQTKGSQQALSSFFIFGKGWRQQYCSIWSFPETDSRPTALPAASTLSQTFFSKRGHSVPKGSVPSAAWLVNAHYTSVTYLPVVSLDDYSCPRSASQLVPPPEEPWHRLVSSHVQTRGSAFLEFLQAVASVVGKVRVI